jgi:hypothetical protein
MILSEAFIYSFLSLGSLKNIRTKCQRNYTEISRKLSVKELKKSNKIKRSLNIQISRAVKAQWFEVQNGNVIGGKCS